VNSDFAAFSLVGQNTDEALRQVIHHDVAAISPGSCTETGLAGVPAILVRPTEPHVPSMRILIGWEVAEYVWERLWQAGQAWNISPLGMDGLDLMVNQGAKR
jgi:glycine cleavage system aminomethyltransferase T